MTIHLGRELPLGSSNLPGGKTGRLVATLFGFAPGGACLARTVARPAGELLPHPFTLTAGEPAAVYSLLRLPGVTSAGRYPAPCPVEPGLSSRRLWASSGHPARRPRRLPSRAACSRSLAQPKRMRPQEPGLAHWSYFLFSAGRRAPAEARASAWRL